MPDIALITNKAVISNQSMSGNLSSGTQDLSNLLGYCVDATWTGAPVGNIIIQGCNDAINWKTISTTAAGGAPGGLLSNNNGIHYAYLQVIYTFTSGTGNLNVIVAGKNYV